MTVQLGSLSPIAPPTPSPNPPRASISSNRSFRRTEADFEAALFNPAATIFLSAAPTLGEQLGPASPPRNDHDAPQPVEKRSFEEDMVPAVTAVKNVGVIPPTPSTMRSDRRLSTTTKGSVKSTPNGMSGSRKMGQSFGIDDELQEGKKATVKRKSIFRSPGTASSPDLATLVRKAKEAKAANGDTVPPTIPAQAKGPPRPTNGMVLSHSIQSHASSSSTKSRNRSTSQASRPQEVSWERFSNGELRSMPTGERMATILEGSGRRSRQSSGEEGFKSMRNKAKGVLGRMFGSSSVQQTSSPSPAGPSSHRPPPIPPSRPPVPAVPPAYMTMKDTPRSSMSSPPPSDVFRQVQPTSPPSNRTPALMASSSFASPEENGPVSVTPTRLRQPSDGSILSVDKPLPPLRPIDDTSPIPPPTRSSASSSNRVSGHTRQAATTHEDDSSSPRSCQNPSPQPTARPSSPDPSQASPSFSDDIAGMFDGIGQSELARELGLPPDSLRSQVRRKSADSRRLPAELGRVDSMERRRSATKSVHLPLPVPNKRTSSLPGSTPQLDRSPRVSQGTVSSPDPSVESSLVPPPTVSRTSSSSSRRRAKTAGTDASYAALSAAPLGSPLLISNAVSGDFGPLSGSGEATLRAKPHGEDLRPLSPQSVSLIASPRPDSIQQTIFNPHTLITNPSTPSAFVNSSPWGAQSPTPASLTPGRMEDLLEFVSSPVTPYLENGEDDEERGRRLACDCLENDFSHVAADKVAEFLGGPRPVHHIALRYYMQYFDMKGQTLVESFRDVCQKLHLKAESQEIDRIIEGFSARYYECNPTTVFGTPGVVHTVTGAMLMLNTDLHIADLNKHMSRADFVRNSLRAVHESIPSADGSSTPDLIRDDGSSVKIASIPSVAPSSVSVRAKPPNHPPNAPRSASAPVVASPAPPSRGDTGSTMNQSARGSSTTVSSFSYSKAWEVEAENALKDIYNQVRSDRILLPTSLSSIDNRQSMSSISNGPYGAGRNTTIRSPSQRSNDRVNVLKRGSIRGAQGLLNNPYQSQPSASDGRFSPTTSFATSSNEGSASFPASIGFASNLSHSVIREQEDEVHSIDSRVSESTLDELDDDELALLGAPWAKEGMLFRKPAVEAGGKKTGSKGHWKQYFVVIQKSDLHLFTFGQSRGSAFAGGSVGGGNWLQNANAVGSWNFMHAVAAILPKPGLGVDRPHSFSLTYPNGQIDFFSAGTDDLVVEWTATANYWAARRSRQPLQGGVSNMEYGWTKVLESAADDQEDKASVKSGRSNLNKMGGTYGRRTIGGGQAEKMHVNDWKPPPPATMPSPLDEESQLQVLIIHVRSLVEELEGHKGMEEPMSRMYLPASRNGFKAKQNWMTKSRYIHSEVYKYETYVEALRSAIALRVKKQGEKKLERSLARSMTSLHRRESADANTDMDESEYEVPDGLRIDTGLKVDAGKGDEEETAVTPMAARTRGVEEGRYRCRLWT